MVIGLLRGRCPIRRSRRNHYGVLRWLHDRQIDIHCGARRGSYGLGGAAAGTSNRHAGRHTRSVVITLAPWRAWGRGARDATGCLVGWNKPEERIPASGAAVVNVEDAAFHQGTSAGSTGHLLASLPRLQYSVALTGSIRAGRYPRSKVGACRSVASCLTHRAACRRLRWHLCTV